MRLLVGDDDVDVIGAAKTMIGHAQQTIRIGRQVDARDLRAFVDDQIEEAGILMREAVVILTPDGGGDQQIQRGDRGAPGDIELGFVQPFGMLVNHRVDDVNERLIGGEEAVPSGQQIAFEPAFQGVFAEHLHDPAVARELAAVGVFGYQFRHPGFLAGLVDGRQPIGAVSSGPKTRKFHVAAHNVAEELAERCACFRFALLRAWAL